MEVGGVAFVIDAKEEGFAGFGFLTIR